LPPEDATWENWELLSSNYHLEDKVILPGDGSDTQSDVNTPLDDSTTTVMPKRLTKRPSYFKDYVTSL